MFNVGNKIRIKHTNKPWYPKAGTLGIIPPQHPQAGELVTARFYFPFINNAGNLCESGRWEDGTPKDGFLQAQFDPNDLEKL
jgi:hypothetical protein